MKKEGPLIYLFLYKKFKDNLFIDQYLETSLVMEILRRNLHHTPSSMFYPILKEMEDLKLIKRVNHMKFHILDTKKDRVLNRFIDAI